MDRYLLPDWLFADGQRPVPKAFRTGTHRLVVPQVTLAHLEPHLVEMGITRVANVTGLDRLGIPVVMVCRPNSRSLSVFQGKGLDLAAAQASGIMEATETFWAERVTQPLLLGSFDELQDTYRLVDVNRLPRRSTAADPRHLPILWLEGFDLLQQQPTWAPYEMVHTDYTLPSAIGTPCFICSSSGLASGNHPLEAINHAICELVERDAAHLFSLQDAAGRAARRVDLSTVDDPICADVLARYDRGSVAVAVWETTTDVSIPAFYCTVTDRSLNPLHPLYAAEGAGCHPSRGVALFRALSEAAQSRLTGISGARDDTPRSTYERMLAPEQLRRSRSAFEEDRPVRPFGSGPGWEAETLDADFEQELVCLRGAGVEQVVAINLAPRDLGVSVVRVIIPGLEPWLHGAPFRPGPRARQRLKKST